MSRTQNLGQKRGGASFLYDEIHKRDKERNLFGMEDRIGTKELESICGMKCDKIRYLVRLIDQHGIEILERKTDITLPNSNWR